MSYRCPHCGHRSTKWMGFCPQCLVDEPLSAEGDLVPGRTAALSPVALGKAGPGEEPRTSVGIGEVDRVLGGGLVPGSVALVGGEPGVGKSTLLLQVAGALAARGGTSLLASGEESTQQIALRAARLGIEAEGGVSLVATDDVDRLLATADQLRPDLLVVDSIQTVAVPELGGGPGGVAQVRESAARIIRFAKERHIAVVLVGHVTKEGGIAGPKLLEHVVDVVLYLEGDPDRGLRALRCLKNRFGASHVVGIFEMGGEGLLEVEDPSKAFLSDWEWEIPGTIAFPAVEGRRSVLVEVQALTNSTTSPQPRRSLRGVEGARVHQILAVLTRHAGMAALSHDVYVNVVGGWRLTEPGSDLPVALALASSILDRPLGSTAAWGEVGLAGEVRRVPFEARRQEEATRVGIERIVAPTGPRGMRLVEALAHAGL